jgi:hypothetical protein
MGGEGCNAGGSGSDSDDGGVGLVMMVAKY